MQTVHVLVVGALEADLWLKKNPDYPDAMGLIVVALDRAGRPSSYWHDAASLQRFGDENQAEMPVLFASSKEAEHRIRRLARDGTRARMALWKHPDYYGQEPLAKYALGVRRFPAQAIG